MERKRNKNLEKMLEKPIDPFDVVYKQATENATDYFEDFLEQVCRNGLNAKEIWEQSGKKNFLEFMKGE